MALRLGGPFDRRRFGRLLDVEQRGSHTGGDHREDNARGRPHGGCEHRGEHRSGDEEQLVGDGFPGERRLQLVRRVHEVRPARPHERSDGADGGAADAGEDEGETDPPVEVDGDDEEGERDEVRDDDGHHDLRLATTVDEARNPGTCKGLDDHVHGGDDACQAVRTGDALDEEDDPESEDGDRHPCDKTCQGELESTGKRQNFPIVCEHQTSLTLPLQPATADPAG
ncbi:Uncharacterised protein [Mycobacteroides abscessus subsp. abscessus]|nr:Uncharacterised protein [Mycobacteroides abscessus subsp. abscessus]